MRLAQKKVLVTGACGFIGSHLVEHLLLQNCDITAFVRYHPLNSWGWLDTLSKEKTKNIRVYAGDVSNYDSVKKSLKNIDIVFHLAALIGIPYSYSSPESYVETNIKGTLNILQASQESNIERILITSTSEVYGSAQYVPIDEKHPLCAQSPYAATKIAADKLAESFYLSFKTPVVIVRPFNTYGPRQSARAVIPTIILQVLSDAPEIKLGRLDPTRDLSYVSDICRGYIEIASCSQSLGKTINVCSSIDISIGDLAKLILDMMNSDKIITAEEERIRPPKSEVTRLVGNNHLLEKLTAWQPQYPLREGLKETIEWFSNKDNMRYFKHNIYNI